MELTPSHLQSEHLDSDALFQFDGVTLWYINTTHPDVVADDYVSARLATAVIFSLDDDRTYAMLVLRNDYSWSDEAIPELLRYVASSLHGSDTDVTDAFSVEVFTGSAVSTPGGRHVWWREDYIDESLE